jgi:hypothetical protein
MVRIRREYDPDPMIGRAIIIQHDGDPYPGMDRRHLLQVVYFYEVPGIQDACFYCTTAAAAVAAAGHLCEQAEIVQDFCRSCHPGRGVNNVPRFQIKRGQSWPVITPSLLLDWL